ncbi:hypothetical protein BGZ95_007154, partial [Linnemannia exigua]
KEVDIDEATNGITGLAAKGSTAAGGAQDLDQAADVEQSSAAHLLASTHVASLWISCCEASETAEQKQALEMHFGIG